MRSIAACRVCDGSLRDVLSLGQHFVSGFPAPGEDDGTRYPLDLVLCERCHLLQLRHTVPAEALYRNYWYRSGTNRTMREALADVAQKAEHLIHLQPGESVLDIGCNDGTLLGSYRTSNVFRIGFDPAKNLAALSRQVADTVVPEFFDAEIYRARADLADRRPKVVTSIAMFYDLDDPGAFVGGVRDVLHPEGVWVVQMSYLPLMLAQHEFGNICHEHLEYYSLQSLDHLLGEFDFEVADMELNDVNGGSFRVYVRRKGADPDAFGDDTYRDLASERVSAFRLEETRMALDQPEAYSDFAFWVERIKNDLVDFIRSQTSTGKKVFVYGASTKGNTVLQYCGLDHSLIEAAADRNPDKWGRRTVGTGIPIVSEEEARRARPDYFLVLPWHFLEEFKDREKEFLLQGGRFIVPMPHFSLV